MCGISGIWQPGAWPNELKALTTEMATRMTPRGPDGAGIWTDEDSDIAFAHRRLSILDLSNAGTQPMQSANGRTTVTFNGEIYNHEALRTMLPHVAFKSRCDAETLVEAIDAWGIAKTVNRLNGMFAFAAWNSKDRSLTLVRDRLGIKPLFWGQAAGSLYFGSDMSIAKSLQERPRLNQSALGEYFRYLHVPAPATIYEGFYQLPPASIVTFAHANDPNPAIDTYWNASATNGNIISDEHVAMEAFERALTNAVAARTISDVPLGAFLSGGVDSSLIAALLAERGTPRTFSIGFDDAAYDESDDAAAVAEAIGSDHTRHRCREQDLLDRVPQLATAYAQPFADSSQLPTLLVCEIARRDVTVALSGDGGDELMLGYNRYTWAPRVANIAERIPQSAKQLAPFAANAFARLPLEYLRRIPRVGQKVPRLPGEKLKKATNALVSPSRFALYDRLRSIWDEPPLRAPPRHESGAPQDWSQESFVRHMSAADLSHYLPGDILTKVDRASMAVSLEVRVPFLDHNVVELANSMPTTLRMKHGPKWISEALLRKRVPNYGHGKAKMGFGAPIDRWLRGALRPWAEDLLSSDTLKAAGHLDVGAIRKAWQAHLGGNDRHHQLWAVLMFETWRRG